jgi:ribonucleotide reductase alpha subunit
MNSCSQGGLRKGSATLFFPIWHQEIRELVVLKNEKGNDETRARSLDYAVSISRLFYERFINNQKITLFSPHDVPGLYDAFGSEEFDELYVRYENDDSIPKEVVDAQELILEILTERTDTGRIYIFNIDHANSHSPYKPMVRMSNLCVAGDTKITILWPDPVYDENGHMHCYQIDTDIEIKDLGDFIENRNTIIEQCIQEGQNPDMIHPITVKSYDLESDEYTSAVITNFSQTSSAADVVKVVTSDDSKYLVLTPDHRVFTAHRGYVKAEELVEGDLLITTIGSGVKSIERQMKGLPACYDLTLEDTKVLRVEIQKEKIPVYDITVEGTHNFFANDILIHNCMEIALLTDPIEHIDDTNGAIALCILSALNVGSLKSEKELEEHCDIIVRQLDELIDIQEYPVKAAELSARKYRPLGVGIIGLAHYLARNSVKYDDPEAVNIVHILSESIQYYLLKASNQLAREKGPCEGFIETKYSDGILPIDTYKKSIDEFCSEPLHHDWESLRSDIVKYGLRNTTLTAAMPSESSSKLSNTTNGIDPPRGHLSVKRRSKIIVPQYTKLKNNYTLAWDMKSNEGYFNIIAVIQKFFDQAISANWYYNPEHYPDNKVPMSVIVRDFLSAYKKGHKSAYYHITYDRNEENKELDDIVNEILESGESDCESCKL